MIGVQLGRSVQNLQSIKTAVKMLYLACVQESLLERKDSTIACRTPSCSSLHDMKSYPSEITIANHDENDDSKDEDEGGNPPALIKANQKLKGDPFTTRRRAFSPLT